MHRAYLQVVSNQGSAGVDDMPVTELLNYLNKNRDAIATAVCNGRYLPKAILGVILGYKVLSFLENCGLIATEYVAISAIFK